MWKDSGNVLIKWIINLQLDVTKDGEAEYNVLNWKDKQGQ